MDRFVEATGLPEVKAIQGLWEEYEKLRSPEARFVMAMDVVLPILLNAENAAQSSWSRHHVSAHAVLERVAAVERFAPALARLARGMIRRGVADGSLHT